jgi:hypothetical protein
MHLHVINYSPINLFLMAMAFIAIGGLAYVTWRSTDKRGK